MKVILTNRGDKVLVDDADFDFLSGIKWCSSKRKDTSYAHSNKAPRIYMHRLLLKVTDKTLFVDHIDGNGLNNQRSNLRTCTGSQNNANRVRTQKNTSSKFLGVYFYKKASKWKVAVKKNGIQYYGGMFSDEITAAKAYDSLAKKIHGEFANPNFK